MVRNLIVDDVTVEDMLRAREIDAADVKAAIQEVMADVDILVAIRVLSELITEMARQLHGVQMHIVVEPREETKQ